MKQILILLSTFLVSVLFIIPAFRALAIRLNIVDRPDGHLKKHAVSTPYLGGVAIFITLWLALFVKASFSQMQVGLFWGTLTILLVGLMDDLIALSPLVKLLGQSLSAVILIYYGFSLKFFWPAFGGQILAFFWLISLMNAFNLVDVMDGLATTIGICATLFLAGYVAYLDQMDLLFILLSFLVAHLAFFYYNKPRATIYLGDAGSMLLGTVIGAVTLKINWLAIGNNAYFNFLIAPIIIGIPAIEVISLIIIRKRKNIPFYRGSRDHYIHFLKAKNWSEWKILMFTAICMGLLGLLSSLIAFSEYSGLLIFIVNICFLPIWYFAIFNK